MKVIQCEMCSSTNLIKENGYFICQHCGTKYSVEEAKKLMVEGTVKIDNRDTVDNYIKLSNSAFKAGNGKSAFEYANKALEIDPENYNAWLSKMLSIEYIATVGELKLPEVIEAGKNAIAFAPESEKVTCEKAVYTYYLTRALELLRIAMNKLNDTDDVTQTYNTFKKISIFKAAQNTADADRKLVNIYDNIADEAIALTKLIPDEILIKYPECAKILKECAKQYKYETDPLIDRYKIYATFLTNDAIEIRNNNISSMNDRSVNALRQSDPNYVDPDAESLKLPPTKKGGCYVATCVYGSYDCPQVWTLRRYRDNTLGASWYGRLFIRLYYAISPTLVKLFGKTNWFKKLWKKKLDRMVLKLQEKGVEDTPYQDKEW